MMPRFSGAGALELMDRHNVNIFVGVPTMYVALLEAAKAGADRPSALRYGISGGSSLPWPSWTDSTTSSASKSTKATG